jgi:ring-1,2-phenylacetyl-CoA epoxidase subunit PaaE
MSTLHFHPLRVREVRPDTEEAMIVSFDVPGEHAELFKFTQGQYLTVRHEVDGQDVRRSYSICAGLDDGELRVGVRKVAGGLFSNWLHQHLKAGDTLQVMPPQGKFFVPLAPEQSRHYLGLAGGSGITPILSIMKTVLAREPGSRFTLVYGNRRPASTMFKEELEDLKNRYMTRLTLHHVFSDEQVDSPLNTGMMNREKIAEFLHTVIDPKQIDHAFVCGPYAMNDEGEAALLEAGVPQERIHIERFGIALQSAGDLAKLHAPKEGDADNAKITIVRDGLTRDIVFRKTDPSILDAAAAAGMDVPYSCKSGVCGTCRAKLVDGQVRMDRNFALEKHEVAEGFILTCQAHPLTPCVTVSFDER